MQCMNQFQFSEASTRYQIPRPPSFLFPFLCFYNVRYFIASCKVDTITKDRLNIRIQCEFELAAKIDTSSRQLSKFKTTEKKLLIVKITISTNMEKRLGLLVSPNAARPPMGVGFG